MIKFISQLVAAVSTCSAMESETIKKNGVSPKDLNVIRSRKNFLIFGMILATVFFTACVENNGNGPANPSTEAGVMINGTKWATRNVGAFGTFVSKPEDVGMFYQWNRKTAWASTNNVTGWNDSCPVGTIWEIANDPCPQGWRVPTVDELDKLVSSGSIWSPKNGMNGRIFGSGNNTVFLPAAGCRGGTGGTLGGVGNYGYYWSSTQDDETDAYQLLFLNEDVFTDKFSRIGGFNVRCVAE